GLDYRTAGVCDPFMTQWASQSANAQRPEAACIHLSQKWASDPILSKLATAVGCNAVCQANGYQTAGMKAAATGGACRAACTQIYNQTGGNSSNASQQLSCDSNGSSGSGGSGGGSGASGGGGGTGGGG